MEACSIKPFALKTREVFCKDRAKDCKDSIICRPLGSSFFPLARAEMRRHKFLRRAGQHIGLWRELGRHHGGQLVHIPGHGLANQDIGVHWHEALPLFACTGAQPFGGEFR